MTYLIYNFKANPKYGTCEYHCKKHSRETKKIKYELDFTKNQQFSAMNCLVGQANKAFEFFCL